MMRRLFVVVFLLLVRRAVAATCTIDTNYGALILPDQLEPAVTSFCHKALETPPSKANDHPPLPLSLPASRKLSSFCSCVLDHIPTSTPKKTSTPLPTKTYTKTLTISVTQSHYITTATTKSITVSKAPSTAVVTVTTCASASTVTASAPTITVSAPAVTVSAPTITISASTTITLSASTTTITVTATPIIPTTTTSPTSSTSTRSTAPTGPPSCTPAANPSGTCAYAADYNSGTTPQLWGGATASLDACALLCAGEPGCLSLAYNPSGALQCVLFNSVTNGLATTSDTGSSTIFYDSTCFACSGGVPPRPLTDDGCTPALQPPAGSMCDSTGLFAGIPLFVISASGNTASSFGACTQQCLALPACQSLSFDGTNCQLYSTTVIQLELNGIVFPVNPGVAGSTVLRDRGCSVCPALGCVCPPPASKRDLARRQIGVERREANVERREAELERRILERERSVMGYG